MAIVLATGTQQTVSATALNPLAPVVASYLAQKDDPGETIYSNIVTALDQPNKLRFSVSPVADVFKNAEATALAGQRVDGLNILCQVTEVWKVYDGADNSVIPYYLPVSAHQVLKIPIDANVTDAAVAALMARLTGATLHGTVLTLTGGIGPLMHGVTRLF